MRTRHLPVRWRHIGTRHPNISSPSLLPRLEPPLPIPPPPITLPRRTPRPRRLRRRRRQPTQLPSSIFHTALPMRLQPRRQRIDLALQLRDLVIRLTLPLPTRRRDHTRPVRLRAPLARHLGSCRVLIASHLQRATRVACARPLEVVRGVGGDTGGESKSKLWCKVQLRAAVHVCLGCPFGPAFRPLEQMCKGGRTTYS